MCSRFRCEVRHDDTVQGRIRYVYSATLTVASNQLFSETFSVARENVSCREQFRNSDENAPINRSCREIIRIFGTSRDKEIPRFLRDISLGASSIFTLFPFRSFTRILYRTRRKNKKDAFFGPFSEVSFLLANTWAKIE